MLSEKRRTILEFIKDYIEEKGYSPSTLAARNGPCAMPPASLGLLLCVPETMDNLVI